MNAINIQALALILGPALLVSFAQSPKSAAPGKVAARPGAPAPAAASPAEDGERNLRMNFRGVPLDMVLNYMSEAAGFVIVMETKVEGKVDAWSNQPLNKTEAVEVLNTILNKNGYAAIRNGKTLKIVKREDAKKEDVPVRAGADPKGIPKSEEFVTQVIPVHYANAAQLTKDLQPLLPSDANMSANESANALVITDTAANVHRMAEIVAALDTSISSISSIKVFPLKYADSKELAAAVKELFTPPTQQPGQNGRGGQFFSQLFGGGRGPGGFGGGPGGFGGNRGGGGGGGGGAGGAGGAPGATRVVAVADERTNSLIVSAPDEYIPVVEGLVKEIDVPITGVTELRVFKLQNSDPLEMAELFAELFPDETNTSRTGGQGQQQSPFGFGGGGFRGGGFRGGGFGGNRNAQQTPSDRMQKMGRVVAVPDQRTSSLIVTASNEVMPQIAEMIAELDSSQARRQKVYVYSLENADVQQVEQVLQDMFQRSTMMNNRNSQNQDSALSTRSRNNQNSLGQNSGAFGNNRGGGAGNNSGLR